MGMKTAVAWWCFERALEPDVLVAAAVAGGYDGVELAPREEWQRVVDAGLALASDRGHLPLEDGLNRRENHDRIEAEILERLAAAEEWGIPNLICFSGNRAGLGDEAGAENTAEGLRRVAKAAEEAGVTLILELLNSKVDHPDYQCDRTAWGVQVCQWVDSPRVKLLYDVYHMQIMEGDLVRTIQTYYPWFGHYHVAGNPGRHEPDAGQEINYPAVYRAIRDTGYDGYVGVEFVPTGDPIAALRAAADALRA